MGKNFEAADDREEEVGRKVAQEIAMKRLEAVPEDSIDFDADYRRSLGMIARGQFMTAADIDKMRARVLATDFSDDEPEIGGVEVDEQSPVEAKEASEVSGTILRVLDYIGDKMNRFWMVVKAKF